LRNHLALRDWLRAHPEDVQAFVKLTRELAARLPCDIGSYVEGNMALITSILQCAGAVSNAEAQPLERQNDVFGTAAAAHQRRQDDATWRAAAAPAAGPT
jgi:hypothetical protein